MYITVLCFHICACVSCCCVSICVLVCVHVHVEYLRACWLPAWSPSSSKTLTPDAPAFVVPSSHGPWKSLWEWRAPPSGTPHQGPCHGLDLENSCFWFWACELLVLGKAWSSLLLIHSESVLCCRSVKVGLLLLNTHPHKPSQDILCFCRKCQPIYFPRPWSKSICTGCTGFFWFCPRPALNGSSDEEQQRLQHRASGMTSSYICGNWGCKKGEPNSRSHG